MGVETRWLAALAECGGVSDVPELSAAALAELDAIFSGFSAADAERVVEIERTTRHDVKAVEYFVKERLAASSSGELRAAGEFVHFACTSEDVNNLAYALMFQGARDGVVLPLMDEVIGELRARAHEHAGAAMLGRTHGQNATPTTMGKEMANFAYRLRRQRDQLAAVPVLGKINGAVGNYNAHAVAYPAVDWPAFAEDFVARRLGLALNPYTTQIEPHDYVAEMSDAAARFNTVLLDLARDMWSYISIGYFRQRAVAGEIGSSTMPHKVNPIDFENAEGNVGVSNALFGHFAAKLPVSRFQRDLSDSTVMRNVGVAFSHQVIALSSVLKGLRRVDVNAERLGEDLDGAWEVLAEPVQTVMRKYAMDSPYEQLKELTRGKRIDRDAMQAFIRSVGLPEHERDALLQLTPRTYLGEAEALAAKV